MLADGLKQRLDALSGRNAELGADVEAASWVVAKLEAELASVQAEARGRASVAEQELSRAEAHLQEQSALTDQLGTSLREK